MPLSFCFKDRVQLNFQSSTLCVSDNSSQSSGFPHLRRYLCPPSTAHDPQEQNLKSCTVQLSITSLHFLHRIVFLTIFIMHVTRSQLSAFTSFFEPQIIFFKALIADIHKMFRNHKHERDAENGISPHTMKYARFRGRLYPYGYCGVSIL